LVRLRAAEALVGISGETVPIFQQVVASRDRYALHAYLTAVENADLLAKLEDELHNFPLLAAEEKPNSRTRCAPVLSVRKRSQFLRKPRSPGDLVIRLLDVLNHTLFGITWPAISPTW